MSISQVYDVSGTMRLMLNDSFQLMRLNWLMGISTKAQCNGVQHHTSYLLVVVICEDNEWRGFASELVIDIFRMMQMRTTSASRFRRNAHFGQCTLLCGYHLLSLSESCSWVNSIRGSGLCGFYNQSMYNTKIIIKVLYYNNMILQQLNTILL